eukprot:876080-Pyramimonas_sp.AAC.1
MYVVHGFPCSGRIVALSCTSAALSAACGIRSRVNSPPWLTSKCSPRRLTKCGSPLADTVGAG